MVIERMDTPDAGEEMFGLTFSLDTRMLEEEYHVTRIKVYSDIERKLLDNGFKHIQYSVYFCSQPSSAISFAFLVRRIFSSFRYAPAIRDLQGFEVKNLASLTDEIADGFNHCVEDELWP